VRRRRRGRQGGKKKGKMAGKEYEAQQKTVEECDKDISRVV
jgi:hypothetical protein